MSTEYQDHCEDEPSALATEEEEAAEAWEYWHQRAQRLDAALYEIEEKEPGMCVFGDPPALSAEDANKLLSQIFIIARVARSTR